MARKSSSDEGTELSRALAALRKQSELRQTDVEERTGISQAQLSRIENGKSIPTAEETAQLAHLYGADRARVDELVQMTKDAKAGIRDTRLVVQRGNTLAMQQRWKRIEGEARIVRSYQPALILGVLQTVEYSSIVLDQPTDSAVVEDRARRHERLINEPDRRHLLIQTEGSLRLRVGSPSVMASQADYLVETSRLANVQIGVIPESRIMDFTAGTGFHIYDDTVVVVGLEVAAATLTDPDDIRHFRALYERLSEAAVWGDEARSLIERVRASLEGGLE